MSELKKINTALISVFHKEGLQPVIEQLNRLNIKIFSTGGTQKFIEELGVKVTAVEDLTGYPSILGGRVKTLHPKVFGGILSRRESESDNKEVKKYDIPLIDLVIVDLYPFEQTVSSEATEAEIIEKIDIGGISLIRAAAKNYVDTVIISNRNQYQYLLDILENNKGATSLEQRKRLAAEAFELSSHYDTAIYNWFGASNEVLKISRHDSRKLRYGENPHQKAWFFGDFDKYFDKLHGKEISYNNLLDIDAAVDLISEFDETTFAILKHNNACGVASRAKLVDAWKDALAGDPVSAFGGILITNEKLDIETAEEINKLFFEVIIAPEYEAAALDILKSKKNRIILIQKHGKQTAKSVRSALDGYLVQERDLKTENEQDFNVVTKKQPDKNQIEDLIFANKIVKHSKSNAIVLAKNKQLCASGVGQTSRVDALKQAIEKAQNFGLKLDNAVMASDAFFPFADSVEIAHKAGITAVIQPGGSIRDKDSIEYCDNNNMSMIFTGTRHFKH